jgi:hypothetical protein
MNSLHRSIIVPLVALVNLILINIFNINLGQEYLDNLTATIVNLVSLVLVGWGIYKNHHTSRSDEIKAELDEDKDLKQVIMDVAKAVEQSNQQKTTTQTTITGENIEVLANEDLVLNVPPKSEEKQ